MGYWDLIEARIQEAIEGGAFKDLPGAGQPLAFDEADRLAGDDWLGFKILRNGDMTPEWMMLGREIERDIARLEETAHRFHNFARWAAEEDDWPGYAGRLARVREQYASLARLIRRKQDQFNHKVPAPALERPGLWVEYLLQRLDESLGAAGAPQGLLATTKDIA